ncbi:hypothetical protein Taro_020888 [Colocasia esculenta]|uniref:Leucine-rich repeat-containing N-terminal plant-type domain-containing protein n=1 Tax=Colocasia esculenta TaxID=4460 RepID=A0A843UXI3_COLES|nr:hypothetical protein [Colocasia esculenta]
MATNAHQHTQLSSLLCSDHRLLLLLALVCLCNAAGGSNSTWGHARGCIYSEKEALLQIKRGLSYDPANRLSSWIVDGSDCCGWNGVGCDNMKGHVIKLDLGSPQNNRSLGGVIGPSLLGISYLAYLDLSNNDFKKKPIPEFMGSLSNLEYLNLSGANLQGRIPHHLGNLSRLQTLDLSKNYGDLSVGGDVRWASHLSSLQHLNLDSVDISSDGSSDKLLVALNMLPSLSRVNLKSCGLKSLPSFAHVNFTSLSFLDLSSNSIQSPFPEWLINITSLEHLDLGGNNFQGGIPSAIGSMSSLTELILSGNGRLDGKLQGNWSGLCKLQSLEMSSMNISGDVNDLERCFSGCIKNSLLSLDLTDNQLSGCFPSWLGEMKRLKHLSLASNSLQGSIPTSLGRLSSLEMLSLSFNNLNGSIPHSLGGLSMLTSLDLRSNYLQGTIPEIIGNLSSLQMLRLGNNSLSGGIPESLGSLSSLQKLDLADNHLSGPIPAKSLSNLSSLQELDLRYNYLGGSVSTAHFSNLKSLITGRVLDSLKHIASRFVNLQSNRLEGEIPEDIGEVMPSLSALVLSNNTLNGSIPRSLCKLLDLEVLDLSRNNFSGNIPNCWKYSSSYALEALHLEHNSLAGVIPSSLSSFSNLRSLKLNANSLSGEFPLSLRTCSNISTLDLGENKISGKIPVWLAESMPYLKVLRLRSNNFKGDIPSNLASLTHLQVIDLANNDLIGTIPCEFGNFTAMKFVHNINETTYWTTTPSSYYGDAIVVEMKGQMLEYQRLLSLIISIDLSNNRLSGSIPQDLADLVGLQNLNISGNMLSEHIMKNINELHWLESLDLSRNNFSGEIPALLSSMTSLSHLNLSFNNFSGRIPQGNQFNKFIDPSIYMGNPYLCGFPLDVPCEDGGKPEHNGNNYQGESEKHKNNNAVWMYVFTALGFILGFWTVCGTLIMHNRWRTMFFIFIDGKFDQLYVFVILLTRRLTRSSYTTCEEKVNNI